MKKFVISSVAVAAFAFAFVASAAVSASEIYTPASGFLRVGSGMGTMARQMPNVIAAQKALNACTGANLALDGKFGPLTKGSFMAFQASKGVKVDGVIGPVTADQLAACSGSTPSTPSTTTLNGGAGDITVTSTSTDVENSVKEGEDDVNILGFQVEADGSDVAITSVKVSLKNTSYASSSEKLSDYLDSVSIMMGGDEVGSSDVSDFSKDSGTPDEFSKTISLKNAVVEEDEKVKFYVAVSAVSTIDSDDITNADWDIQVDTIRFNDATGAILTGDVTDLEYGDNDAFTFDDAGVDDDISIKSSSTDPDAATLLVEENDNSDEYLIGAFKLDVDEDSSDITISELPIVLTFAASGNTTDDGYADSSEDIVDNVRVKVGSDWYDADFDSESITDGVGTAAYLVEDEFTIDAGDAPVVGIYVTFKEQDSNYGSGATVIASVTGSAISAEGEDDVTVSSSFAGEEHTLSTTGAKVTSISWVANGGGAAAGSLDFFFTVEAENGDVDITDDAFDAVDTLTTTGSASIAAAVVTKVSGTATGTTDDYTVEEGQTARFRVRYAVTGSAGSAEVTVTEAAGNSVPDDKELSPTLFLE